MLVTIIIPTYNRSNLIRFTLDSVAAERQNGVELQVVVVDDNSTDDTCDYISEHYPNVTLLKNKGRGAPAARNTGLRNAKGKYILYLDSDDLLGENFLYKKVEELEKDTKLTACYGEYEFFNSDGAFSESAIRFKHKYSLITAKDNSRQHLLNNLSGNYLPPITIVWRKDFLVKLGGHDESLTINQDVDLMFRAIFAGASILGVKDGTKAYIRHHSLDDRVGATGGGSVKMNQILALRKRVFSELKQSNFKGIEYGAALSGFLFNQWKTMRHKDKQIADAFLSFAREVYWPVKVTGKVGYKVMGKILGPVGAVKLKYFLFKRD